MKKAVLVVIILVFSTIGVIIKVKENKDSEISNMNYVLHNDTSEYMSKYSKRGYYVDLPSESGESYYYTIAMGAKSSGGYSISITDVKINKKNVKVTVKESETSDMFVTQAFTYPICCLELSEYPNSIIIKNTHGERFYEIVD